MKSDLKKQQTQTPDFSQLEDVESESWGWFKSMVGVWIEDENPEDTQYPFISLLFIVTCISFYFFSKSSEEYILNPHDLFRKGGFNVLSYSFIHTNLSHLVKNIFFLFPFISKVEDKLGHLKTLAFIIASAAGGALMHTAFDHIGLPLVGANAVCFSYIVYYGLVFKNNRLRITVRNRFKRLLYPKDIEKKPIPAGGFALMYIILMLLEVKSQRTLTSHLGHIGGAIVAVIVYFITVDESEKQN